MNNVQPRYVLIGGKVMSPRDGDIHYVSAVRLVGLYQLHPKDCIIKNRDELFLMGAILNHFIVLGPRTHGDYLEHRFKKEQQWLKDHGR